MSEIKNNTDAFGLLCIMGQELNSLNDIDSILQKLNEFCCRICNSEKTSIMLLDDEKKELYFRKAGGIYGENLEKIRVPLKEKSIAGWVVENRTHLVVEDVEKSPLHYKGVDKYTGYVTKNILAVPVIWQDTVFGCMEAINKKNNEMFDDKDIDYATILSSIAAISLNNSFYLRNLQNFLMYTVEILITGFDALEPSYKGHITRMARYCTSLAREIGMRGKELESIWHAAYFHDIGKLKSKLIIANGIEYHPFIGAKMLENIMLLEKIIPIIKMHHEKFDGSGYPKGIKGFDMPVGARILSLVEDYEDFMVRHGVSENTPQKIKDEFFSECGKRHDPALVEKFRRII